MRLRFGDPKDILFTMLLFGCLAGCARTTLDADGLIASAKSVIANHEREAMAGNLDGIMNNCAMDIAVLAAGSRPVEGFGAMREFYASMLAAGSVEFTHDYFGADLVGNAVVLHGISRGTLTPPEGPPIPMENNFLMILRPDENGVMKVWRVAFAPVSM